MIRIRKQKQPSSLFVALGTTLGVALGLGIITMMTTTNRATAFFDPCRICHVFLTTCCPKPCSTKDPGRISAERAKNVAQGKRIFLEDQRNRQHEERNRVFGVDGVRHAHTQNTCRTTDQVPPRNDPWSLQRAWQPTDRADDSLYVEQERLRQRAVMESAQTHVAVTAALPETRKAILEAASQGTQAQDLRDLVRAITAVRTASLPLQDLITQTQIARTRIDIAHSVPDPEIR